MAASAIGQLRERSLHAALKAWYQQPGDRLEVEVDGFVVDLVREGELLEIQTGSFASLKRKLPHLLERHRLRLVFPVAAELWIVRLDLDSGAVLGRRKSPKRARLEEVFRELVSFPELLRHPGFSLEVALVQAEEVRVQDGRGSFRRKGWSVRDRCLLSVLDQQRFDHPDDFRRLLPESLPDPFTTAELAEAAALPRWLAPKMAYCLRGMGVVVASGRGREGVRYTREPAAVLEA